MRRAAAIVTLLGVILSPLAVMWCTCACAGDDDASAGGRVAIGAAVPVVSAEDDCPSTGIAGTSQAVVDARAHHSGLVRLAISAVAITAVAVRSSATRPAPLASSQGPPGLSSVSVLRI